MLAFSIIKPIRSLAPSNTFNVLKCHKYLRNPRNISILSQAKLTLPNITCIFEHLANQESPPLKHNKLMHFRGGQTPNWPNVWKHTWYLEYFMLSQAKTNITKYCVYFQTFGNNDPSPWNALIYCVSRGGGLLIGQMFESARDIWHLLILNQAKLIFPNITRIFKHLTN